MQRKFFFNKPPYFRIANKRRIPPPAGPRATRRLERPGFRAPLLCRAV